MLDRTRRLCTWLILALAYCAPACIFSSCDKGTPGVGAAAQQTSGTIPVAVQPSNLPLPKPGTKTVAQEKAGDKSYDKSFDDLRFEMTIGQPFRREMLPEKIEAMKEERIRIRGFILPTPQQRGIKTFVLVRDNQQCCFGPGAALYDCILVEMQPGKTTEFSILPVTVEGTFNIQEFRGPDGKHLAIYHLAADSAK